MPHFTDSQGRDWKVPALTVADLSKLKEQGGVDLWAVVQGKGIVDEDIGKLAKLFDLLCRAQIQKLGSLTTVAIAGFVTEWMSDGDNIVAFRHAIETELIRFFPSPTRPIWQALVESRSPASILSLISTGSVASPGAIPPPSTVTSGSSGDSAGPSSPLN